MLKDLPIKFHIESHKTILSLIQSHKKISAAELSRISGLQKSSLLYILRALESKSLIKIHTLSYKTEERGRPSTLYEINDTLYTILGVELFSKKIKMVLTGFSGKILHKEVINFIFTIERISDFYKIVESTLKKWNITFDKLLGIGVVLSGMIDPISGDIIKSTPLKIIQYPLGAKLQKIFSVPVKICNDAKAGAMGTYLFSSKKQRAWDNILYFSIDLEFRGIGIGFILDGKPYFGATGHSGEIYMSLPAVSALAIKPGRTSMDTELDREYKKLSRLLAKVIVNNSQLLNPDYIEIGGDVTSCKLLIKDYLKPEIDRLQKKQYPEHYTPPILNISPYNTFANPLGGAASILQEILK